MREASWRFFPSGVGGQGAIAQLGVGGHEAVRAFQDHSKQGAGRLTRDSLTLPKTHIEKFGGRKVLLVKMCQQVKRDTRH